MLKNYEVMHYSIYFVQRPISTSSKTHPEHGANATMLNSWTSQSYAVKISPLPTTNGTSGKYDVVTFSWHMVAMLRFLQLPFPVVFAVQPYQKLEVIRLRTALKTRCYFVLHAQSFSCYE